MFRRMQGWKVLLVAGGTVAESKAASDQGKGKTPTHDWAPSQSQEFHCQNDESWADILNRMDGRRRGAPRR